MQSTDIKCMICHVCVVMVITILQRKHANAAYPLEEDISHLTGIDPPKRWLVFMEIRVRRCMDLLPVRHQLSTDLLSFVHCLTLGYKPQARCLRSRFPTGIYSRWKIKASVSSNWMLFSRGIKCSCYCPIRQQRYQILVHKLFGLNLTMAEFTALDSSRVNPLPAQCRRATVKFIVFYNNGSITYCGKRKPWSIYSNSNMATIELVLTENFMLYSIMLSLKMEVVDLFYSTKQYPSRTAGPSAWGSFEIFTYHIAVEMMYRVRILMPFDFRQNTKFKCYDGPDAKMPMLPLYRKLDNQTVYISSTFQLLCMFAFKGANPMFNLHYSSENPIGDTQYIYPNEKVILKNNTGCGNSGMASWMCIYHIVSPNHMYAQIRISALHIYGIFANMHSSVGVAIYNIMHNKTSLVGHWCYSIIAGKNLTLTGSGNRLIFSAYAYSPYSLIFVEFTTYASICIGGFIGKRIRPSMVSTVVRVPSSLTSSSETFHITFDDTNHCHAIHISFLPTEYPLEEPSIRIYFQRGQLIRLNRNILGMSTYVRHGLFAVTVCGIYTRSLSFKGYMSHILASNFEIIGDIQYVHLDVLPIFGNIPVTIFTVSPTACIQQSSSIFPGMSERFSSFNICKYEWLVSTTSRKLYEAKPGASITIERVYGFHPILILVNPLKNYLCPTNELIRYVSHGLSLRSLSGNVFSPFVYEGDYWRFEKSKVVKVHEDPEIGTCAKLSIPTSVKSWGMHVYIVVFGFQVRGSSWQRWRDRCAEYGANILTIDDYHELYYIVQNIMLEYSITLTPVEAHRRLRTLVN